MRPIRAFTSVILVLAWAVTSANSAAGSAAQASHIVSDKALGIAMTLPPGLVQSNQARPHEMLIVRPGTSKPNYTILQIDALEMAPPSSAAAAEWRAASDIISNGYSPLGGISRIRMTIAGEPALVLRSNKFGTSMVFFVYYNAGPRLSATRLVYEMTLPPGKTVAMYQRQVISTLRFIPRTQFFPCQTAPWLSVAPNPVRLHREISVVLSCAKSNHVYFFAGAPFNKGFGGGDLGSHRTGAYGTAIFRHPGFQFKGEARKWELRAYDKSNQSPVAVAWLWVRNK